MLLALLLSLLPPASAQETPAAPAIGARTLVVLPFENESHAPGLEWISESFPEVLGARMALPELYVLGREDRDYAFDRSGIPTNVHLSHATLYRIVEQMDMDYVVMGHYNFDGQTFTAAAQVLDMKKLRLLPVVEDSGPLLRLIEIQRGLAWTLLKQILPEFATPKSDFVGSAPLVRLDAFESYIRGVTAGTSQEKIQRFRETIRLNPGYTPAILQLGKTYFAARDYESAASWFARLPKTDSLAREGNFYLGLSAFYLGDYERAENAFAFVASRMPLTEVYNNLGVVAGRRGRRSELEYFHKAVDADPNDADYRFNLALAEYRAGETGAAGREAREAVALRPSDTEAKSLLDTIGNGTTHAPGNSRLPLARIKRNYDENSYRQLALEIQNLTEARLAKTDPKTHAAFHIERGNEFLERGFYREAEAAFREATALDPANPAGHLGLARVLENDGQAEAARSEAQAALRLQPSAAAFLVLGRLDLKDNNLQAAAEDARQALALEPSNASAREFKKQVDSRLTGKEQP